MHLNYPAWLLVLVPTVPFVVWLAWRSDAQLSPTRRAIATTLRLLVLAAFVLALAELNWERRAEGMNLFFLLDRSESIPPGQQEAARQYVTQSAGEKMESDRAGVIVFGGNTGIEFHPKSIVKLDDVQAVVDPTATDIGAAIRLATAALPESGQRRLVLLSDGNENLGDAIDAATEAASLGASIDVLPMHSRHRNDALVKNLTIPGQLKKGQTFEAKIFIESQEDTTGLLRLYRNDQFLGEQRIRLEAGKNLYTFAQQLEESGFYAYAARLEVTGDNIIQNNRATGYTWVRGDPRVLVISSDPQADRPLVRALQDGRLEVQQVGLAGMPETLTELHGYDALFLSNVSAGERSHDEWRLVESAVRDFGVGLVCIGGDQAFGAGGYRGTPLERFLPVRMELDSKKVLPRGALVMVMHGMEFNNGNQVARDMALGALEALGPRDELGVLLWDGSERWLFNLQPVGDKREMGRLISGMNQGDLPGFQGVMQKGYQALQESSANLKHMIVFSDGDPSPPSNALMQSIREDRITVSSVLIAGHSGPETMIQIAEQGGGRFYHITSPDDLPQVFLKETAVILKSAIFEEPFVPQTAGYSEIVRGISSYPQLLGYVATTPKERADLPLVTEKGDPLLAHWQYGLGRTVAFTSDARAKWARNWIPWNQYQPFWNQIAQWSLRKLAAGNFNAEVHIENGQGTLIAEAVDQAGNFRNFLNLNATVVDPQGNQRLVDLEQTGPGHYEARFPAHRVGAYQLGLMQWENDQLVGLQSLGANVNYSPEFNTTRPDLNLLTRIAESTGGRVLDPFLPADNPFLHDRREVRRPIPLWNTLLQWALILFVLDVAIRRILLDREQITAGLHALRRTLGLHVAPSPQPADSTLNTLLARRHQLRQQWQQSSHIPPPTTEPPPETTPIQDSPPKPQPTPPKSPLPETAEDPSPTSRLLRAKRRAQRWKKNNN